MRTGDVLVATTRPNLNAVAIVAERHDGAVCSTGFCVLRGGDELEPEYLFYYVQSPYFIGRLVDLTKGALYPAVTDKQVFGQPMPWVPREQQKWVAHDLKLRLHEASTAFRAVGQQSEEVSALQAAIYRDAFQRIAPITVPPVFGEPPSGWRWRKLGDLARLESGHTPSRSRPDWWGGEVSWLSLTEIRALDGRWVERTELRTNAAGIANSAARILPRGTVCFSRTASVGFVAIMAQPMATSQDFANWVCGDELDPEFLMHALIRCRKDLRELATGATHKTIYMPTLESFHVCLPPLPEQQRIVAALKQQLAEVASLRAALDVQRKELAALPQRILAQAFNPSSTR